MGAYSPIRRRWRASVPGSRVGRLDRGQAEGFVEDKSDHQHDEQIDRAVDAAEKHLGQNRRQQDGQS
jgi:hypothetical protein